MLSMRVPPYPCPEGSTRVICSQALWSHIPGSALEMKYCLSWELLPPCATWPLPFQSRWLDPPLLIFPPLLMFGQWFENMNLLFVPAAWEQLSLGLLYMGSRSQQMLPFCCPEPLHVNQDSASGTVGHRKDPWSWSIHFC